MTTERAIVTSAEGEFLGHLIVREGHPVQFWSKYQQDILDVKDWWAIGEILLGHERDPDDEPYDDATQRRLDSLHGDWNFSTREFPDGNESPVIATRGRGLE